MAHRSPLGSHWQRLAHILALAAGWLLFFGMWVVVARDPLAWGGIGVLGALIAGSLVVFPLITLWWVTHNLGIYRRKGPRLSSNNPPLDYSRDWYKRPVRADWEQVRSARVVRVSIQGEAKCFEAVQLDD